MLNNEKIVLTGCNSGIGLETLKLLAAEKSNVIFAVDKNIDIISKFGSNVIPFQKDVSSKEAVDEIFEKAVAEMGDITLFYANAGYPYYEKIDYADWNRTSAMFETNVFSPIYSYEKYQQFLNGKKGKFAITISAIGRMAMPGYTIYSASKFAMEGFQQGIRLEKPDNIQLTCLYPIATDTGFFKAANPHEFEKPFPVQKPDIVARKMVQGIEAGKKEVCPSGLFTFAMGLFTVLPPVKTVYLSMEKSKLARFIKSLEGEKK